MSVADAELFDEHVKHLHAKLALEKYLRESGVPFSILRPCAFFENLDDAANWNPLKKGVVKFLSLQDCKYCATYDIGRAAAIQLKNPQQWLGKTLDVIGVQGDLSQVAAAMPKVSGLPVKARLAMPLFLRREFKKILPDALSAEDWFHFHGQYSNGDKIVRGA